MKAFLALLCIVAPALAVAHPGHDHAHWSSFIVHAALGLPVLIAIIYAFVVYTKSKARQD